MKKNIIKSVFILCVLFWITNTYASQCISKTVKTTNVFYDDIEKNFAVRYDSSTYSWTKVIEQSDSLIINWKDLKTKFYSISIFKFSPNGKNYAFIAIDKKGWKSLLYKNWKPLVGSEQVSDFNYSVDWESIYHMSMSQYLATSKFQLMKDWQLVSEPNLLGDLKSHWYQTFLIEYFKQMGYEILSLWNTSSRWLAVKDTNWKSFYYIDWKPKYNLIPWKNPSVVFSQNWDWENYQTEINCKNKECVIDNNWKIIWNKNWYENIEILDYDEMIDSNKNRKIFLYQGKDMSSYGYPQILKSNDWKHSLIISTKTNKDMSSYDTVIYDNKILWKFLRVHSMVISPNWDVYYVWRTEKGETVYKGNMQYSNTYNQVTESTLSISKDWNHISYVWESNWKKIMVMDEKILWKYDSIEQIQYLPNFSNIVYVALNNHSYSVYRGSEKIWGNYAKIRGISFSVDSSKIAFSVRLLKTDKTFFVINWKEEGPYDDFDEVYNTGIIKFSKDSKDYSYSVITYSWKETLVMNGKNLDFWLKSIWYKFLVNGDYNIYTYFWYKSDSNSKTKNQYFTYEICK